MNINQINADKLQLLQGYENEGRGINCVRQLVVELRAERMVSAAAIASNEWDKISSYPKVAQMIKDLRLINQDAYISYHMVD